MSTRGQHLVRKSLLLLLSACCWLVCATGFAAEQPATSAERTVFTPAATNKLPALITVSTRTSPACAELTCTDTSGPWSAPHVFHGASSTENALCGPLSLRQDLGRFFPQLWHDTRGLLTWENAAILGATTAGALVIRNNWDDDVRRQTAEHPEQWGDIGHNIGNLGDATYQVPVLLGVYGYSLHTQDAELHDFSTALLSAYTITGLTTSTLKLVTNTERPSPEWNDGQYGFPSFHAASSFTVAGVVEEYYGWQAGAAACTVAGLISYSRIDERDHDLSDITFGAVIGYAIGKSVAAQRRGRDNTFRWTTWQHPLNGTPGVGWDWRF